MGIVLGSNFDVQTNLPLDSRLKVADTTARDALDSGVRYEGMLVYVVADGTNYQLVGGIANANWAELSGSGGGSGAGQFLSDVSGDDANFLVDSNWVIYNDGTGAGTDSGIKPIDGTGGTNSGLGFYDGRLENDNPSSGAKGNGISLDYQPNTYHSGLPMKMSFYLNGSPQMVYGDSPLNPSSFRVFLYNVTDSEFVSLSTNDISSKGVFQATFQYKTIGDTYRLIIHCADSNTSLALQMDVANLVITPALNQTVNAISDPDAAWVPVTTGFGTISSSVGSVWREGKFLIGEGSFVTGTVGSSFGSIELPYGLRMDASALAIKTNTTSAYGSQVGRYDTSVVAPNQSGVWVTAPGTSLTKIYMSNVLNSSATHVQPSSNVGSNGVNSSSTVTFKFKVPIKGWTSGYSHPAQIGLNANATFSANTASNAGSTSTPFNYTNIIKDSVGGYSSGVYTVQSPGDYFVSAKNYTGGSVHLEVYINGVNASRGVQATASTIGAVEYLATNLTYGNTIEIRPSGSATANGSALFNQLHIFKLGSQSQHYAPRVAYIQHVESAGVDGGNLTGAGAFYARTSNYVSGDQSFMSIDTSTGTAGIGGSATAFILQPGQYLIDIPVAAQSASSFQARLYDNTNGEVASDIGGLEMYSTDGYTRSDSNQGRANTFIRGTINVSAATSFSVQLKVNSNYVNVLGYTSSSTGHSKYMNGIITKVL